VLNLFLALSEVWVVDDDVLGGVVCVACWA